MNKCESEVMSFPSDILSQEEQDEILREISDIPDVNEMVHILSNNSNINGENDFNEEKEYKDKIVIVVPANEHSIPPIISNILSNEEYPGPFEFEVDICPNGSKNPWVYSPPLNKIFMDMNSPFPVDFKIKNRPQNSLFIRVTPVYSLPQHSQDFVYRCINHEHPMETSNRNVKENVRQHIIRCSNSSAIYLGDKEKSQRLSVAIPLSLPQSGTESVREMFQFVCKNSCPTPGMNRRPIEAIFTLEDVSGHVLGRQTLRVRICSCPKRDKEKEEKEHSDNTRLPRGKKRKVEKSEKKPVASSDVDNKEYKLTLNIVGKHNAQQVLKYSHDLMAGEYIRHGSNGGEVYKNCLNGINNLMSKPLD
ncbi:cellular tumor antigen p53 [Anoplophora glabripennis]|uniref:cellular tumor antigen p53 n=1 Tax=Anoplophora glabripennis TaxID=217634 RepID=UPI000873769F|nr:cellular tumor antigen p53 [Anoplophora glabripennis]